MEQLSEFRQRGFALLAILIFVFLIFGRRILILCIVVERIDHTFKRIGILAIRRLMLILRNILRVERRVRGRFRRGLLAGFDFILRRFDGSSGIGASPTSGTGALSGKSSAS